VLADPRKKESPGTSATPSLKTTTKPVCTWLAQVVRWAAWLPDAEDITDIAWSPDGSQIAVVTQWPKMGHTRTAFVCGRLQRIGDTPSGGDSQRNQRHRLAQGGQELVFAAPARLSSLPSHLDGARSRADLPSIALQT